MRAAFARLCNTLEEVASRERPDEKGDSRILLVADLEMLRQKADDLMKLDDEIMDLLLRADTQEDELDMQGADEYAHKYKRLNLQV